MFLWETETFINWRIINTVGLQQFDDLLGVSGVTETPQNETHLLSNFTQTFTVSSSEATGMSSHTETPNTEMFDNNIEDPKDVVKEKEGTEEQGEEQGEAESNRTKEAGEEEEEKEEEEEGERGQESTEKNEESNRTEGQKEEKENTSRRTTGIIKEVSDPSNILTRLKRKASRVSQEFYRTFDKKLSPLYKSK